MRLDCQLRPLGTRHHPPPATGGVRLHTQRGSLPGATGRPIHLFWSTLAAENPARPEKTV